MAINNIDFDKIDQAITHRRGQLKTATMALSLLKNSNDFVRDGLVQTCIENSGVNIPAELRPMVPQMSKLISKLVADIPPEVLGKASKLDQEAAALHSQLKAGAQQLLLGEKAAENVGSLMKTAADNLHGDAGKFSDTIGGISKEATDYLDNFQAAVADTPGLSKFSSDLKASLPSMKAKLEEARQKTVELQSRVLSGGDFSPQRIQAIKTPLELAKTVVPALPKIASIFYPGSPKIDIPEFPGSSLLSGLITPGGETEGQITLDRGGGNLVERAKQAQSDFDDLATRITNLSTFREGILENIKPGDLMKSSFSTLYDVYKEAISEVDAASTKMGASPDKAMSAVSSVIGKVNSMMGIFQTLGNKKFQTDLKDTAIPVVQKMMGFAENLKTMLSPDGLVSQIKSQVGTMVRDVKAIGQLANRLMNGRVPSISTLAALAGRVSSVATSIQSGVTTLRNVVNTFEMKPTASAAAFMASVGQLAPSAEEAILTGNAAQLSGTLTSLDMMNQYSAALVQLKNFAGQYGNMSIADAANLGVMISWLSGRSAAGNGSRYLASVAAQRSRAVKELELINDSQLKPMEMLLSRIKNIKIKDT